VGSVRDVREAEVICPTGFPANSAALPSEASPFLYHSTASRILPRVTGSPCDPRAGRVAIAPAPRHLHRRSDWPPHCGPTPFTEHSITWVKAKSAVPLLLPSPRLAASEVGFQLFLHEKRGLAFILCRTDPPCSSAQCGRLASGWCWGRIERDVWRLALAGAARMTLSGVPIGLIAAGGATDHLRYHPPRLGVMLRMIAPVCLYALLRNKVFPTCS